MYSIQTRYVVSMATYSCIIYLIIVEQRYHIGPKIIESAALYDTGPGIYVKKLMINGVVHVT